MNDSNLLGHLISIESEASLLVEGARAEADKRIAESEKAGRLLYEECYRREALNHEAIFLQEVQKAREECDAELAAYCAELDSMPVDRKRFASVLESLFSEGA